MPEHVKSVDISITQENATEAMRWWLQEKMFRETVTITKLDFTHQRQVRRQPGIR